MKLLFKIYAKLNYTIKLQKSILCKTNDNKSAEI